MFGWTVDKMTIWKSVQKTAREIEFKLDPDEQPRGEADGSGIPINGIKKRGKELVAFPIGDPFPPQSSTHRA
ncbi:MAG: hypothetical protein HY786_06670 [Deltaproteobacteria bacterium]|nr:hypothetical protein [Deltaproteobacteria bacterium]